ncbi:pseudouridine synthase [Methylogaea oryzae]|uniref:tRNA pseudouridine synthase C n=1 Tax=Methylogaea oryzae TaxID=1295382 RepID=A0A8D5AKS7_9GAMM|nr:pseudouridine synthase [Methylogaea oryzae]BBL72119.1 tRNA pseudouridine synthase TruC [Methylogaea oryzae]
MSRETLPIVYQDDHFVAVHKPSGLLVHRTVLDFHERRFALQILRDQLGRKVYPVHRLDKGTSGLLLFALNPDVARALSGLFETQQVHKTYLAVVRGHPPEQGEIDHPLVKRPDDMEWVGEAQECGAQAALTRYRRLATAELPYPVDRYPSSRYALLQLEPATGRRHQLRRHLKHISHPIIGDATYGKGKHNRLFQELYGSSRLLLACVALRFAHPVSGEALALEAPLAEDFAVVARGLGW